MIIVLPSKEKLYAIVTKPDFAQLSRGIMFTFETCFKIKCVDQVSYAIPIPEQQLFVKLGG